MIVKYFKRNSWLSFGESMKKRFRGGSFEVEDGHVDM